MMPARINGQITAGTVSVASEDSAPLGVFAIADALKFVAVRKQDLVEIGPEAVPPVCQAIDYGKYVTAGFGRRRTDVNYRPHQPPLVFRLPDELKFTLQACGGSI